MVDNGLDICIQTLEVTQKELHQALALQKYFPIHHWVQKGHSLLTLH